MLQFIVEKVSDRAVEERRICKDLHIVFGLQPDLSPFSDIDGSYRSIIVLSNSLRLLLAPRDCNASARAVDLRPWGAL